MGQFSNVCRIGFGPVRVNSTVVLRLAGLPTPLRASGTGLCPPVWLRFLAWITTVNVAFWRFLQTGLELPEPFVESPGLHIQLGLVSEGLPIRRWASLAP
jgi:hypothetical protein